MRVLHEERELRAGVCSSFTCVFALLLIQQHACVWTLAQAACGGNTKTDTLCAAPKESEQGV
jgi:hypothetical protein